MKLEWMGEYRDVVEQLIKYCNVYAAAYRKEFKPGTDIPMSFAQIQVIEYLLENEELHQNMKQIAKRLGITTSNFSKLVNKLEEKELLEKFHTEENKKEVIIKVTDYGRNVYKDYSDYIYRSHFSMMFEAAKEIPRECLPQIANMLAAPYAKEQCERKEKPKLVPIHKKNN